MVLAHWIDLDIISVLTHLDSSMAVLYSGFIFWSIILNDSFYSNRGLRRKRERTYYVRV